MGEWRNGYPAALGRSWRDLAYLAACVASADRPVLQLESGVILNIPNVLMFRPVCAGPLKTSSRRFVLTARIYKSIFHDSTFIRRSLSTHIPIAAGPKEEIDHLKPKRF